MYQSPYVIKRPAKSVSKRRSSNVSNWICFYKNLLYFIETNYPDESIQEWEIVLFCSQQIKQIDRAKSAEKTNAFSC